MRGKTDIYRTIGEYPFLPPLPPTHTHPHIYTRRAFDSYKPMFELVAGFEALHEQLALIGKGRKQRGWKERNILLRSNILCTFEAHSSFSSISLSFSIHHSSFFSILPLLLFSNLSILFSLALIRKSD